MIMKKCHTVLSCVSMVCRPHFGTLVGSELQPEDFWGLRNFALSILTITYPEPGQQIFDYMYDTISGFLTSGSWYFSLA